MEIAVLVSWLARLVFVCLALLVGTAAVIRAAFFNPAPSAWLSLTGVAIGGAMLTYAQVSYPLAWGGHGGRMWMKYGPPGVVFESTTYAFAALLFVLGYVISTWHVRRATSSTQMATSETSVALPVALRDATTPPTVVLWTIPAFRWIMALTVTLLIGFVAGLEAHDVLQTMIREWRRATLGSDYDHP